MEPLELLVTHNDQTPPRTINRDKIRRDIREAAYRFWIAERRAVSAIVGGGIRLFGMLEIDTLTGVPIIGRPGACDPFFPFL